MNKWERPARTGLQVLIALVPVVPFLVPELGLSATAGVGATLITVASLASRIMLIPEIKKAIDEAELNSD